MKIMVAYDGTLQAKEALVYGLNKARETGGEVVALHVFNTALFVDYDAHLDAESMARRESSLLVEEAKTIIREKENGVRAALFSADGDPETTIIDFAKERKADVLLCPPKFKGIINRYQRSLGNAEFAADAAKMNLAVLSTKSM